MGSVCARPIACLLLDRLLLTARTIELECVISSRSPLRSTDEAADEALKTQLPVAQVALRPAAPEDVSILYDWRNDPVTRAYSKNTSEIGWDEHVAWFAASLRNPDRRIFIATDADASIGVIRGDRGPLGWTLSWSVAPNWRGRGVLKLMIQAILGQLSGVVRAEIKSANIASMRAARSAGLTMTGRNGDLTLWTVNR